MNNRPVLRLAALLVLIAFADRLLAQVPQLINYQGRVTVGAVNFAGAGAFKFALVDATGATSYWSNDGTSVNGSEPAAAVALAVNAGLYSVLLGDATLPNMIVVSATVFTHADVRLRVWFNDGVHGSQMLSPDQRIAAVGYAMVAGNVPDGAITSAKLAPASVKGTHLAAGAVTSTNLASGAVAENLAASGLGVLPSGGVVFATEPRSATLLNAGYIHLGQVQLQAESWATCASGNAPAGRQNHTAVWTGSEMLVWGGNDGLGGHLNTGGRHNPATNSWAPLGITGAPSARSFHTAVWTGDRMMVWGGSNSTPGGSGGLGDGARYNPVANTWTPTQATAAPSERYRHTAVWTGSEMIVWGGYSAGALGGIPLNNGSRYNPTADAWVPVQKHTIAPRFVHTAVWTGTEMIVWGGISSGSVSVDTGGRYDPVTDSWKDTQLTAAPSSRAYHTAVWTGTEMVVWGGDNGNTALNTGARYDPLSNSWTATGITGAPGIRAHHTAVWTNDVMVVWGGNSGSFFNTGGCYDPVNDAWSSTQMDSAPGVRIDHTAVWSGTEMIVWGGNGGTVLNTGGRYNPAADSWAAMQTSGSPTTRYLHTGVWTGSEMIVWGGWRTVVLGDGGRYQPATNTWAAMTATGAPTARQWHTAVWTGSEMIVWGGTNNAGTIYNDGRRYNPAADTWTPTSSSAAPGARRSHTAVWTGNEMIIWGGVQGTSPFYANDGGRYNPTSNTWQSMTAVGAPVGRFGHTAVWTGIHMIMWGGSGYSSSGYLNTGGRYNPGNNSWSATSTVGAPGERLWHSAVWTGQYMIVWGGGSAAIDAFGDGGRYNPTTDNWAAMNAVGSPNKRLAHTAVWTGSEMIVWGGYFPYASKNSGARYSPSADTWAVTTTVGAAGGRNGHTAVWTGSEMIVWGGSNGGYAAGTFCYTPPRTMHLYSRE